jgi:hypothetical protein
LFIDIVWAIESVLLEPQLFENPQRRCVPGLDAGDDLRRAKRLEGVMHARLRSFSSETSLPMARLEMVGEFEFRALSVEVKPAGADDLPARLLRDGPKANAVKILCRDSTLQSPLRRTKMFKRLADVSHDFTIAPDGQRIRGIVELPRPQEKPLGFQDDRHTAYYADPALDIGRWANGTDGGMRYRSI